MIHIEIIDRNMNRSMIWKSCIVVTLILLGCSAAQACSLLRAEYKNVADVKARLRIGTSPDGDTSFKFSSPTQKEKQVPFAQVVDRVQIKRYNARGRAVGPKSPSKNFMKDYRVFVA
jgi:hypothetical protein